MLTKFQIMKFDIKYRIDYIIILATVITNLLSAIPFIGGDLVPLSIILSLYLLYIYIILKMPSLLVLPSLSKGIKIFNNQFNILNNISNKQDIKHISNKSHTKDKEISFLDKDIKNINRNLLALIVGFIDGDGYIRITKKRKENLNNLIEGQDKSLNTRDYIYISLIINLNANDLELLQYFHKNLNIGKVYNITPKKGNKLAR